MEKMREEFEAWVTRHRPGSQVEMDVECLDEYMHLETQYAWEGWQAAMKAKEPNNG